MTSEEYKQIENIFRPIKLIDDLQEIKNDISTLNRVLSTAYLDESAARSLIQDINTKHPDNRLFYILLNPPIGTPIPIKNAPADCLQQDLIWKKNYLSIKASAKTLDEVIHQLQCFYQRNI